MYSELKEIQGVMSGVVYLPPLSIPFRADLQEFHLAGQMTYDKMNPGDNTLSEETVELNERLSALMKLANDVVHDVIMNIGASEFMNNQEFTLQVLGINFDAAATTLSLEAELIAKTGVEVNGYPIVQVRVLTLRHEDADTILKPQS